MKKLQETEKIHITDEPAKPADIEQVKKSLLSNEIEDSEVVNLGLNRNQFFIRLPTRMTDSLNLTKDDKIKIVLTGTPEKKELKLEVIKHV